MMKGFLAAAAIALIAVAAQPRSAGADADGSKASRPSAAPVPQPAIASENGITPASPGFPEIVPAAAASGPATLAGLRAPAAAGRPAVLIAAHVREKYRPFLESLTSP